MCIYFLKRPTRMGFYFFLFLVLVKIKYAQTLLKNIHKKDILGTRAREFCLTNLGVCFRNNIHNKLVFFLFVCFAFVWYSYRVQRHIFVTIGKQWIMCVFFSLFAFFCFFTLFPSSTHECVCECVCIILPCLTCFTIEVLREPKI